MTTVRPIGTEQRTFLLQISTIFHPSIRSGLCTRFLERPLIVRGARGDDSAFYFVRQESIVSNCCVESCLIARAFN